MKMRGIILFVLSFWTAISMAQGNPPPAGAFIYSAGSWIAASSTYTGSPINAPPPVALYCLNSSNQWVPANSSCTLGGGNITWPATGDIVVSNSSNSPAGLAPVNGECVIGSGGAWVAGSCSGSGTSVTSVTGDSNIITNSASTGAVTLTIAGTSGGIPYFASTSSWRTSALLATNALVVGGGAGAAPATGNGDFTYATHTLTGGASALLTLAATNALTLSAMSGTACLEEVSGVVTSTGAACGTTSLAFSGITSGTNSAAAMLVGTGASLGVSGTGTINATSVNSNTFPASAGLTSGGLIYGSSASVYASDADFTISSHTLSGGASALISLAAANALTLSAMTGTSCLEEVSGVVTATGSACGSGGGTAESSITAPTTTNTITETAAGDWIARNGVETASLTAPWSFSNANSTNNNTSSALIVGVTGSSTGGVALVLNDVSGTGDEFRIYHGSTVSSNALTGGSLEFNIDNSGDFTAAGIGIVKGAGAASTAGFALTGAPFTGGSGTTTYPFFYLNDGTAPTTWSTSGTEFGVNSPSGFTGNMLDFHVNGGASVAKLDYQGNLTVASCSGCSGTPSLIFPLTVSGTTTSGGIPYFSSTTVLTSSALLATNHVLLGGGAGSAPTSDSNLDDGATTANTLTYGGAGGIKASAGPLTSSNPSGGVGSSFFLTQEGTVPSGLATSAEDNCYADSTQHGILCNFNAGTTLPLIQGPASNTTLDLAEFSGTNGGKLIDTGILTANVVTLAGSQTLTNKTLTSPVLGGTPDASGATQFKLPVAAGYTSAANGELGYDPTNKNWHLWGNGVDNLSLLIPASDTVTNGHCPEFSFVSNLLTVIDSGSTCGSDSGGGTSGWSGTPITFISSATQYAPPVGGSLTSTTESVADVASPVAQTISNLSVSLSAALGASATLQVTFRDGGVSQALTCTTAAGGSSCVDSTHSFNVAKGDLIDFQLVSSGTVTAGVPQIVITYAAGTSSVGVTSVSVVTANGVSGSVATATTTPAITLTLGAITPTTVVPTGEITTVASTTTTAGLNLPPGAAPTSPVNGDLWSTSSGFYGRVAGTTVGPFAASGGGGGNVIYCSGSASATAATCAGVPSGATTYTGMTGYFIAGANSTGAPLTINVNSLGAENAYLNGVATSSTNRVISGQIYPFYYDGTEFQLVAPGVPPAPSFSLPGASSGGSTAGLANSATQYSIMNYIYVPPIASFSNIYLNVSTDDTTHLYSVGLYTPAGAAVCVSTAADVTATGFFAFPCQSAATWQGGMLLLVGCGAATTVQINAGYGSQTLPYSSAQFGTVTAGQCSTTSITPPSAGEVSAIPLVGGVLR